MDADLRLAFDPALPISAAVDDLCLELRPLALELVEGLGVEERWLNAAMLRG